MAASIRPGAQLHEAIGTALGRVTWRIRVGGDAGLARSRGLIDKAIGYSAAAASATFTPIAAIDQYQRALTLHGQGQPVCARRGHDAGAGVSHSL
jgi:hypothetical protein